MPNKIDATDWLYRMVRPTHHNGDELSPDAYDDKYEAQSFNLVHLSSPQATLEKFAEFPGTRKVCSKKAGEPNPTYLEMYDVGYRVAVCSVRVILENGLTFRPEPNGDEYNASNGHVNVIGAKHKAAILASYSRLLTREETESGFHPPAQATAENL